MRVLRGLLGAVLWLLAAVVGLVGVVLCVTVILLPLGIPVLMLARRLFALAVRLMLPRAVVHPVDELKKTTGRRGKRAASAVDSGVAAVAKRGRKASGKTAGKASGLMHSGKKKVRRTRRRLG
ncbi:hypothetical protein ncot_11050 [Nocardioides sp. JQ2195]|uniref:hypothetical protein n=1 Tax=Nocardioides sp. JQ2195 TaxID=2592334 RepID=UPI00143ECFDD|nr:hypothetical protein [Nocardioides sp. JQ2195]QIX25145.1 hypothetical protein ncot_11050 [Nocardioides sp. JQ2195]